ncbi:MAG TPA: 16S rRNA (uracil(1498)-N(3))-methyltransferase [Casimicrobiaceae bacterium]|jgi:16S rRNA (uracil1498-N3)-methyltransferase
MHAPRFFCTTPLSVADRDQELDLPRETARHVAQALRMRVSDPLTLFTGNGGEFAATITRIDKRGVAVRIGAFDPVEREASHAVTLVQAIIAADMMDLVVRKAVELGVAAIVPVLAARSQRSPEARAIKRTERWRQIVIAACEQCGRNCVPQIADVISLPDWLNSDAAGSDALLLAPEATASYATVIRERLPRFIVVGPEGGFTLQERAHAVCRGIALARFGVRVLRAETAALAALSTIVALDDARMAT